MKRLALILVSAFLGCDDGRSSGDTTVRDSSGVAIVKHQSLVPSAEWRLSPEPRLTIGVATGEEPYQLFQVMDAVRAGDGRIYILNASTAELRVFSAAGVYQRSFGRKGSGPGEFRYPTRAWVLSGDSVAIWDAPIGPLLVFSPDGSVARSRTVDREALMRLLGPGTFTEDVRAFPDGRLIVAAAQSGFGSDQPNEGMYRPQFQIGLVNRDLTELAPLGTYGGVEQMNVNLEGRRRSAVAYFSPHFEIAMTANPIRVTIGNGDVYELRTFDSTGQLRQIVRHNGSLSPVSDADQDAVRADILQRNDPSRRPLIERMYAAVPDQDFFPAHGQLLYDELDNLWVSHYRWPPSEASRWIIFDENGRLIAEATAETPGRLVQIGADFVLALETNEDGVERVALYDLLKRASAQ